MMFVVDKNWMAFRFKRILLFIIVSVSFVSIHAEDADSFYVTSIVPDSEEWTGDTESTNETDSTDSQRVHKFFYSIGGNAGINHLLNIEMRGEKLVKRGWGSNYALFFDWQANPLDSTASVYDRAFGFPALEAGIQMLDYSHTRLHTGNTPYMSTIGYIWTAYIGFRRDIYRNRRWAFSYSLENGLALCSRTYEALDNIDNDFIGQHLSMFFDFGFHAAYKISPAVEIGLGLEYKHVSNGATDRPNKGSNSYGLTMLARCDLNRPVNDKGMTYAQRLKCLRAINVPVFEPYMYLDVNASVGFRTLYEEWILRREHLPQDDPLYHDGNLGLHTVWYANLIPMFRYNKVHASGIGLEYSFGGYTSRSAKIERKLGLDNTYSYSKHVLTIAGHHEVFYKSMSLAVSVGTYLYRQHGWVQRQYEPAVFETVGIRYYPRFFKPFYVGYNVRANLGKAYDMELKVGIHAGHWKLKKSH